MRCASALLSRLPPCVAQDETALIDVPDNLQRLSSFLGQGQRSPLRTATADKEAVAALARGEPLFRSVTEEMHELGRLARGPTVDMVTAEALQEEARALFKHMSIGGCHAAGGCECGGLVLPARGGACCGVRHPPGPRNPCAHTPSPACRRGGRSGGSQCLCQRAGGDAYHSCRAQQRPRGGQR